MDGGSGIVTFVFVMCCKVVVGIWLVSGWWWKFIGSVGNVVVVIYDWCIFIMWFEIIWYLLGIMWIIWLGNVVMFG